MGLEKKILLQIEKETKELVGTWMNGNRKDVVQALAVMPPLRAALVTSYFVDAVGGPETEILQALLLNRID